jgi:hypothetical protein
MPTSGSATTSSNHRFGNQRVVEPRPLRLAKMNASLGPNGMDPDEIRRELHDLGAAGNQHVVGEPWRSDIEPWLMPVERLALIAGIVPPSVSADRMHRVDDTDPIQARAGFTQHSKGLRHHERCSEFVVGGVFAATHVWY